MIICNTTYLVAEASDSKWVAWIRDNHLPAVKKIPGVLSCRFLKLLSTVDNEGITYTVQTELDSLEASEEFLRTLDPKLQSRMLEEFSDQVVFFQTILKIM